MTAYDTYIRTTYQPTLAKWEPLNKEQAEELFKQHACLFFNQDGVPIHTVFEQFGYIVADAVRNIMRLNPGEYGNSCNDLDYVNRRGFLQAVTLANAKALAEYQQPMNQACDKDFARREAAQKNRAGA